MNLTSSNVFKVASWEFTRGIKTPMFLVLTFMMPILMSLGGVAGYLAERSYTPETIKVGILDQTNDTQGYFKQYTGTINNVEVVQYTDSPDRIAENLVESDLDGVVVLTEEGISTGVVPVYTMNTQLKTNLLEMVLSGPVSMYRLAQSGIDPNLVMEITSGGVQVVPEVLWTPEEGTAEPSQQVQWFEKDAAEAIVPIIVSLILLMATLFSGQMLMYGIIKEKRNRIVEILLSSMSSEELLLGKILGFGSLSLAQISIWVAAGVIIGSRFWDLSQLLPGPKVLISSILFFIFGYFLLASIFAATGASMKEAEEGSQAYGLIILIPMAPMFFISLLMMTPNALWARILSHVPPFIPAMVLLRMAFTDIPWWEFGTTLLVLILSIYLFVRLGAKVFEEGILQYDRNLSFKDLKNIISRKRSM
jgi:ABC-2 type transport system permease protein